MTLRKTLTNWQRRVDSLSLRERVILFAAAVILQLAVLDQTVLAPANRANLAWQRQNTRNLQALTQLRQDLTQAESAAPSASRPATPAQLAVQGLAQAQQEIRQLEANLAAAPSDGPDATARPDLQALLKSTLRKHPGVQLLGLGSGQPPSTGHTAPREVWQSVDLTLTGRYVDLTAVLNGLARDLPGLRWGDLRLITDNGATVLTVRLWHAGATG